MKDSALIADLPVGEILQKPQRDEIIDRLTSRYRGRWLQGYVRGKLGGDPAFAAVWEHLGASPLPLLDIGCGMGLLAFYLRERGCRMPILGVDLDAEKIASARKVGAENYTDLDFQAQDAGHIRDFQGNVTLIDVLHYLAPEEQQAVLRQVVSQIAPGGICLIRETLREANWRFRVTQCEEWLLHCTRWQKSAVSYFSSVEEMSAPFAEAGFRVTKMPLWGGTPFNSYLFIFQRPTETGPG